MCLAKIICVEGPDQMGKQTQANLLFLDLRSSVLREIPFNDHFTYALIYFMLENGFAKRFHNLFQFVQFCNKLLFQTFHLMPMMLMYDFIVLDRWYASSIVYGDATGVNKRFNHMLQKFLIKPDVTFILEGQRYKRPYEKNDSYESDKILQDSVKLGYKLFSENINNNALMINNEGTPSEVHHKIICELRRLQMINL
jgi:thymidylate kinase